MRFLILFSIHKLLNERLRLLEKHFEADVLNYFGQFINVLDNKIFLEIVEDLADDENKKEKIYIILTTGGGDVHVVVKFVNVLRHHYKEVNFIVPDFAYSAGTVFCMSGDSILMDYYSVLGPIDPQVQNREGKLVAALGYLDKIKELLDKAKKKYTYTSRISYS